MAKVLVTMPDEFLNKVDGLADVEKLTRSELIREALKNYMHRLSKTQIASASKNAQLLDEILK